MRKACDNGPGAMVLTNSEIYRAMIAAAPVVESEEPVAWVSLSELRWLKLYQHAESAMTSASLSVHRTDFHTTPLYASPTAQPATSSGTNSITADALRDALSNNLPLSTDQRAVLFTMVVEADTIQQKFDAELERIRAQAQPATSQQTGEKP
jgi:hypothetical protein